MINSDNKLSIRLASVAIVLATFLSAISIALWCPVAWAWDSAAFKKVWGITINLNPRPTHTYLTKWAIDQLKDQYPELQQSNVREALVDGANSELHELPVSGEKYGIDLEAKRKEHKGTNEGTDDIKGWWEDGLKAYRDGNKEQAYFYLGVMLHMIEDMGVPAHANGLYHQAPRKGEWLNFDNFEFAAFLPGRWNPSFDNINRSDPNYSEPWQYYSFSQNWTHTDAPDYKDINTFSKFDLSAQELELLQNRQGRTCFVTMWTLNSAIKAFKV